MKVTKNQPQVVASELQVSEAHHSKAKATAEMDTPDPDAADAAEAIARNVLEEDGGFAAAED
jgi:hypothetical protein